MRDAYSADFSFAGAHRILHASRPRGAAPDNIVPIMTENYSRRAFLGALGAGSIASSVAAAATYTPAMVPVISKELWGWYRSQLVLDAGLTWLDTAHFGPTLRAVMSREYRNRERESGDFATFQNDALGPDAVRARLLDLAVYLGATPDDLTLTSGTLEGLNLVAHGIDLQPGDEVLTTMHDHPAAVYPWLLEARRRGIKVVQLQQPGVPESSESIVARFAAAITPRTRVLAFSHVQYTDGTVMPARELCILARANNAISLVDGAQAPGLIDTQLAAMGCDAYAMSFHKWLNGAYGTGALYVRADTRARIWPLTVERPTGWEVADRFGVSPPPLTAPADSWPVAQAKFGHASRVLAASLEGSSIAIELQQAVNRTRIGARQRELAIYLRLQLSTLPGTAVLTPAQPALWCGILAFRVANRDHATLVQALAREERIVVRHVQHSTAFDAIRVSLHAYNDHAEIDRLVNALRRRI
jgi:selenocysteine lyase/cysteine desulfurase